MEARDGDSDRVRRLVEIDAAVSDTAVVLDLEGEARISEAVGVRGRRELELAEVDISDARPLTSTLFPYTTLFRSHRRHRRDRDRRQTVGRRRIIRIAETEIGGRERVR